MQGDRLRLLWLGHTPSIFAAVEKAIIFSSIDASFVALDADSSLLPPLHIELMKGGGPFEWPNCEF
jgi:hypothetical protein